MKIVEILAEFKTLRVWWLSAKEVQIEEHQCQPASPFCCYFLILSSNRASLEWELIYSLRTIESVISLLRLQAVVLIMSVCPMTVMIWVLFLQKTQVQNECYICNLKCLQSTGKYLRLISGVLTDVVIGYSHIPLSATNAMASFSNMSSICLHGFLLEIRYNAAIIRECRTGQIQQRWLQHKPCEMCITFTSWGWHSCRDIFFSVLLCPQRNMSI